MATKPEQKPNNPCFGSGPCAKRPGYQVEVALKDAALGRSHRSTLGKGKIVKAIEQTKKFLEVPADYYLGIVPGSDTGAFEMAMWNLLGPLPVDVFHWESFGKGWLKDANTLKLQANSYTAEFGKLPDLSKANPAHDIIFTWNGTTSGVKVPNADWISDQRTGLTLCDATSAAFAMELPWHKLDVVTFSWQKVLGGEAAHGVLILSPAARKRLEGFQSPHPIPKLLQLRNDKGKLNEEIFQGGVINTISMMALEDYLDALNWAEGFGLRGLIARSEKNLSVLEEFVEKNKDWIDFLAENKAIRSNTSVCLKVSLPADKIKQLTTMLSKEKVAFDIDSYREAPPGLRIWCGSTVETPDLALLLQWIHWAYLSLK